MILLRLSRAAIADASALVIGAVGLILVRVGRKLWMVVDDNLVLPGEEE